MKRAYYSNKIPAFCRASPDEILGQMAQAHSFDLTGTQRDAWLEQTHLLRKILSTYYGAIYFEFSIPRMGKRIDAVIIIGPVVFVVEFKVGATEFLAADLDQVTDYALDLKNFHEGSHNCYMAPILVSTDVNRQRDTVDHTLLKGRLFPPLRTNADGLAAIIAEVLNLVTEDAVNTEAWEHSGYRPTPTIIEATLALYNGHSVAEISRSDAGAINLSRTSQTVTDIIATSKDRSQKSICFVTGVPGAGKTLVGLNIATAHIDKDDDLYSVFLSGNGPLVLILQEALARDKVRREKEKGRKIRKTEARSEVKAFIQNVHHFRDDCLINENKAPIEHIAIFDEAQRAWDLKMTSDFMRRKKNVSGFNMSEPEFLISCLDRHDDWAVVICLVGGGQEINTGEAGIREWIEALERSHPDWQIFVSDQLTDSEYGAGKVVEELKTKRNVEFKSDLHLATSVRSFRSEKVSLLVKQLLDLDAVDARETLKEVQNKYPLVLTRNLTKGKRWLREQARGSERYGIVASSQAERLKPYAVDVKSPMNPVHWFLNGKDDVRSSYYLEQVATEFHIQGLELDWACIAWDADFRYRDGAWHHWSFRGKKWQRIMKAERQNYLKNAYRVLLTRARQGIVVVVPMGDSADPTRDPAYYDGTFEYLKSLGFQSI